MQPLVEISYCPWGLAGSCKTATDAYNASICPPSLNGSFAEGNREYAAMVAAFVAHLIERYGKSEVEQWKFEFWNEPNGRVTTVTHARTTSTFV